MQKKSLAHAILAVVHGISLVLLLSLHSAPLHPSEPNKRGTSCVQGMTSLRLLHMPLLASLDTATAGQPASKLVPINSIVAFNRKPILTILFRYISHLTSNMIFHALALGCTYNTTRHPAITQVIVQIIWGREVSRRLHC